MILTPSSTSSLAAGFSFWTLVWASIEHIDSVPYLNKIIHKEKIYRYVNKNKATTLIGTEIVNFTIHGVSNPLAVTMAIGGSIVNALVIYLAIPFRQKKMLEKEGRAVLEGV